MGAAPGAGPAAPAYALAPEEPAEAPEEPAEEVAYDGADPEAATGDTPGDPLLFAWPAPLGEDEAVAPGLEVCDGCGWELAALTGVELGGSGTDGTATVGTETVGRGTEGTETDGIGTGVEPRL